MTIVAIFWVVAEGKHLWNKRKLRECSRTLLPFSEKFERCYTYTYTYTALSALQAVKFGYRERECEYGEVNVKINIEKVRDRNVLR